MSFLAPKPPKPVAPTLAPAPPRVDEAAASIDAADRLRRRRGRNSYIFGGKAPGPTAVATKTLTGQ